MFSNRADAARQLARRLVHLKGRRPLVLAVPPRAVSMAQIIADALHGELDVVLVETLKGAPGAPDLAVATVSVVFVSSLTMPVMLRPSSRSILVAAYSFGTTADGSKMFSSR